MNGTVSTFCAALLVLGIAQEVPPSRQSAAGIDPTHRQFKTSADVVAVDVNVLDRDGRPVDNLSTKDFSVFVDGQPRRITSAEFVRLTPSARTSTPSPYYSSNLDSANGRLVMLVIDQGNISAGRARAVADAATRFIKRLAPVDRVALSVVPGAGAQINFTTNHAIVEAQVRGIEGRATTSGLERVGVGEALRIERGDRMALGAAVDRECTGTDREVCLQELTAEARDVAAEARQRARDSIAALRALVGRLAGNQAPKTIVYVSEALVIDQEHSELAWLGPLAAKGGLTVHVLRIDASGADASASRRSTNRGDDRAAAEEGLSLLAGLTRGSLYRVVGKADEIFERLTRELSGHYLIGFATEAGDQDGQSHKIKLEIPGRRNLEVRARREFSIEATRQRTSEEVLREALSAPGLMTDIPLRLTAYTFPGQESGELRILIAAEIHRRQEASGSLAVGYALMGPRGEVVASRFEPDVKTPISQDGMQSFTTAASTTAAGVYGLKLAVVDDAGRAGTVEHAFKAQLTTAGRTQAGDLLIGEPSGGGQGAAAAAVRGEFVESESLHGYLEMRAETPESWKEVEVVFEIAAREDSRPLSSTPALVDASGQLSRRSMEGVLPIGLLPPGEYYARAVVRIGGRKAAQLGRPFRIVRSTATAAGSDAGRRTTARGAAAFSIRIDPFQRASVLTKDAVVAFVDRIGAEGRAPVPLEVTKLVQTGDVDGAAKAAAAAGHPLAAAFLEGLTLYGKGDMERAAVKFRDAIKVDSEFFPAIFYLGACYAAGGRDHDAAAAWQTSLVGEGTPLMYALLADALLRLRETESAIQLLEEALGRWPEDSGVQSRLATALAMAGRSDDALEAFDRYLERNPEDTERLFLALRLVYEGRANGRSKRTLEEDQARFDAYATAYSAHGGQQTDLVGRWREFLNKREF
jgi:VWFA-related protein